MRVQGNITYVGPKQSGTSQRGTNWVARDFVVEYNHGQYPNSICFRCMDVNIVDKLKVGLEVSVDFDINAEPYTDKNGNKRMMNRVGIWRNGLHCIGASQDTAQAQGVQQPAPQPQSQAQVQNANEEDKSLPF